MHLLLNFINNFESNTDVRSLKALKNIILMLFYKGGNIFIGLLLIPLTINYVDSDNYGVWLTLSSMVAWVQFFDVGIGNGLKNKLAEALAVSDFHLACKYVSTTYAFLIFIFIPLSIIFLAAIPYIDWNSVLCISSINATELVTTIQITTLYFCLNFIFSTINIIMTADQDPSGSSRLSFLQQCATLVTVFILTKTTTGNLIYLGLSLCLPPFVITIIFNLFLFKTKYKLIAPRHKMVDFQVMPKLLGLGAQFFIIQIAVLVQYQLFNFLIIRYFGANEVTAYNVANKLFNVIFMFWSILTTPLWVGVTDAIIKRDYSWIRHTMAKYTKFCMFFIVMCLLLFFASPFIFDLWIGDSVYISRKLTLCIMFYNCNLIISNLATSFINGAGILKIQTIMSCITPFIFIMCSLLLIKGGMGIESIFIAAIIANINGIIIAPIQTFNYIRKFK